MSRPVHRWEILLCGSGGQGLGMAGKILANAALDDGLFAAQSQSYGARARGGYSASGVVLHNRTINFPLIEQPNLLLVLTEEAYQKNAHLEQGADYIIYDQDFVNPAPAQHRYGFPLAQWAQDLGNPKGIAILSLGVFTAILGKVTPASMEKAIAASLPPALVKINLDCFRKGLAVQNNLP